MEWVILGIVVVLIVWLVMVYNRLVTLRQVTGQSWSDVDVQLKQRHDLIPNLVETVKGYAAHEKTTLEAVIQARNAAVTAQAQGPAAAGPAEGALGAALGRLFLASRQLENGMIEGETVRCPRVTCPVCDRTGARPRHPHGADLGASPTAMARCRSLGRAARLTPARIRAKPRMW